MKWDKCTYLQERKRLAKESFESKRNVFRSCGRTIADRERYQHSNMNMDEEDSDSEEENYSECELCGWTSYSYSTMTCESCQLCVCQGCDRVIFLLLPIDQFLLDQDRCRW